MLKKRQLEPFAGVKVENKPRPDIQIKPVEILSPDFDIWKHRYVKEQKQPELYSILLPIFLGNLKSEQAIELSDFLANFGENVMRCTQQQNLSIRNIPGEYLGNGYQVVTTISDLSTGPKFISNSIACTGAELCALGICLSRGAMRAIDKKLKQSELSIDDTGDLKLNISGCPDTCGLHTLADLGFYGGAARKNQIMYPAYTIVAGSIVKDGHSRLARKIDKISARNLPDFVVEFLKLYLLKKEDYLSFAAYIDDCGEADIRNICDKYRDVPEFDDDKSYYLDWEAKEVFSVIGMGMGECSAGLFDLIDVDREIIKKQQNRLTSLTESDEISQALYKIVLSASRMLLITRGIETRSDHEVFYEFGKHFIEAGLVARPFKKLIATAKKKDYTPLRDRKHQVYELASTMEKLYASMDDSLRFPTEKEGELKAHNRIENVLDDNNEVFRDYRGVPCPMNFVKVKLDLAMMASGQLLQVLLDDGEPIENVPRSVADEGHEIEKQKKEGGFWSVFIRKT